MAKQFPSPFDYYHHPLPIVGQNSDQYHILSEQWNQSTQNLNSGQMGTGFQPSGIAVPPQIDGFVSDNTKQPSMVSRSVNIMKQHHSLRQPMPILYHEQPDSGFPPPMVSRSVNIMKQHYSQRQPMPIKYHEQPDSGVSPPMVSRSEDIMRQHYSQRQLMPIMYHEQPDSGVPPPMVSRSEDITRQRHTQCQPMSNLYHGQPDRRVPPINITVPPPKAFQSKEIMRQHHSQLQTTPNLYHVQPDSGVPPPMVSRSEDITRQHHSQHQPMLNLYHEQADVKVPPENFTVPPPMVGYSGDDTIQCDVNDSNSQPTRNIYRKHPDNRFLLANFSGVPELVGHSNKSTMPCSLDESPLLQSTNPEQPDSRLQTTSCAARPPFFAHSEFTARQRSPNETQMLLNVHCKPQGTELCSTHLASISLLPTRSVPQSPLVMLKTLPTAPRIPLPHQAAQLPPPPVPPYAFTYMPSRSASLSSLGAFTGGDISKHSIIASGKGLPYSDGRRQPLLDSADIPCQKDDAHASDDHLEEDRQWIVNWLCRRQGIFANKAIKPSSNNQVKIYEVKELLCHILNLTKELEKMVKTLSVINKSLDDNEWMERHKEIEEKKVELAECFQEVSKLDLEAVKVKLKKRQKKRHRQKRLKEEHRWEVEERMANQQRLHKKIDDWLEDMQEAVERSRREEDLKREADAVLSDVTRKKAEARRQISLLSSLLKLRNARVVARLARRQPVSEQQVASFDTVVEKLKKLWTDQIRGYSMEEKGLRVMLCEAEVARKDTQERREREALREWEAGLFGHDGGSNGQPDNWQAFIDIRRAWDGYVVPEGTVMSSAMPVGWVVPSRPSSADWSNLLQDKYARARHA